VYSESDADEEEHPDEDDDDASSFSILPTGGSKRKRSTSSAAAAASSSSSSSPTPCSSTATTTKHPQTSSTNSSNVSKRLLTLEELRAKYPPNTYNQHAINPKYKRTAILIEQSPLELPAFLQTLCQSHAIRLEPATFTSLRDALRWKSHVTEDHMREQTAAALKRAVRDSPYPAFAKAFRLGASSRATFVRELANCFNLDFACSSLTQLVVDFLGFICNLNLHVEVVQAGKRNEGLGNIHFPKNKRSVTESTPEGKRIQTTIYYCRTRYYISKSTKCEICNKTK